MTSARQTAANSINARRSTGPRSPAGKQRSSQNARKHGLAVAVMDVPGLSEEVTQLAQAIAGAQAATPAVLEAAIKVAAATLDLARIRVARRDMLRRSAHVSGSSSAPFQNPSELSEETWRAFILDMEPHLTRLARYERRAFSRRAAAFRSLSLALSER